MKRNVAVLLVLMTIFLFIFLSSSRYEKNIENGVVELILQIDTGVVCSRHIENCVVDITDSSLRNVFIEFGVTTIRTALYNRYKDGLLIDGGDGLATSMWHLVEVI